MSEAEVARVCEELAARTPDRREEYQLAAEQARERARKAREVMHALGD